jgi:AraC family transcriptional regulator, regulatory protein of adaptative response / methylated-DNA-[protein]-cysteine methyltransferase
MANVAKVSKRGKLLARKAKPELTHYHEGGEEIYFGLGKCILGDLLVAESKKGICVVAVGDDANKLVVRLHAKFPQANLIAGDSKFQRLVTEVIKYIKSPQRKNPFKLDVRGTEFQKKVWAAVRKIPFGATASYADIAERVGSPRAVRAVGTTCTVNPLAVLVPCHRVVKSGPVKKLQGGVSLKERLLELEAG